MYKILITFLSLFSAGVLAQNTSTGGNINTVGNRVFLSQTKLIKTSEVRDGDPYYNGASFLKADIPNYSKNLQKLRYNAYSDEMEFTSDNEVYIADKESGMIVNFEDLNKKYICLNYNFGFGDRYGYLVLLVSNPQKYSLYKREKFELLKGEKSINGINKDRNDYYSKEKDLYLLSYNGDFKKIDNSKKNLLEAFGSKSNEVDLYLKTNKINFKKESDLIKLISYMNTL
ncbi:hypothetical protein [Chryseobacterium indoltheticum]|uniref:WG repeat-containing protein n=1 Tax=Chryseobacterium indoltheticum TaxID=254 RepID=A0A3G6N9D0_9FLAO|nr:hypothetical protein [Chryseobacterium indoltheticum]AZA61519.1 hypothetical protein EG340_10930 [Chryseobacterium indoltheticum]